MLAPICLFTYNRPEEIKQTVDALQRNYLASESELYIFSDGAKNEALDGSKIQEVRRYIHKIKGFKKIELFESQTNKGLANSIIDGVTQIINQYGKIIVLEDDLITAANFLDFMNQALDYYADNTQIFSISGYSMNLPSLKNYEKDYYLGYRASSWGWGTWEDRWKNIDWQITDYNLFTRNPIQQIRFMRGGSDMPRMLMNQMKGKIDSWAIRWCYNQFKRNQMTIFPSKSKITSIGFGQSATHTLKKRRFETTLDIGEQRIFKFELNSSTNKQIIKEFKRKFSITNRLYDKFR